MNARVWEEVLAEFRALGGTADNICLRNGAYGRGIFPIDPAKPIAIHVPENLLIDVADARFENGKFRVGRNSNAGFRETVFFENYENLFSWGGGGRTEIEMIFEQAQTLPLQMRQTLEADYHFGEWFDDPTEALIQRRFIDARCVHYRSRRILMPVVELLNHDPEGSHFEMKNGIGLRGVFSGEVFAKYSDTDPYGVFTNWGFACEQPQAFSLALKNKREQGSIQIGRDLTTLSPTKRFWAPGISTGDGEIKFQFLMIGNKTHPRVCKGIFQKLMREAGFLNVDEAFDVIRHANLTQITGLLSEIENIEGPMAQTLRRVARYQLQALSWCFGVREI
jgi:hypothetical protein